MNHPCLRSKHPVWKFKEPALIHCCFCFFFIGDRDDNSTDLFQIQSHLLSAVNQKHSLSVFHPAFHKLDRDSPSWSQLTTPPAASLGTSLSSPLDGRNASVGWAWWHVLAASLTVMSQGNTFQKLLFTWGEGGRKRGEEEQMSDTSPRG